MPTRRIGSDDIRVNEPLLWDAYTESGRLLLKRGQVIISERQIKRLIEIGLYIELDPEYKAQPADPDAEKPTVVSMLLQARRKLERLCTDVQTRQSTDLAAGVAQIRQLVQHAGAQNSALALALMVLDEDGRYSIRHMIDTATVSLALAHSLGLSDAETDATVAAALTMNISMLILQDRLQQQTFPVAAQQREQIQAHPAEGVQILQANGVSDALWLRAVAEHHEALDGSGYPGRKKGDEICRAAQIVSLADIHCARISTQSYRRALLPHAALRELFVTQKDTHAAELAQHLVKVMGIFPPGSCVELHNGEIAIVLHGGEKANTPQVAAIVGPRGEPYAEPLRRDTSHAAFAVRKAMPKVKLVAGMKLSTLWGKDAIY